MEKAKLLYVIGIWATSAALCACASRMSTRSSLGRHPEYDQANSAFGENEIYDAKISKPLDKGKRTYVLLQVDGGGIMGITPATVLACLEKEMIAKRPGFRDKHLKDILSVCSGTSTGAIITGMVSANVSASDIASFYTDQGVKLFRDAAYPIPIFPLFHPKFDRAKFQDKLFGVLDEQHPKKAKTDHEFKLSDLDKQKGGAPLLIIPAYDLRSKRTHFLRSRRGKDQPLQPAYDMGLVDAISCSALNAALYFGKVEAPNNRWEYVTAEGTRSEFTGAVYNDGGQGTQNNTLGLVMLEALSRGWGMQDDEQVVIISLGCGDDFPNNSYASTRRLRGAAQIWRYVFKGEAKEEAALLQWRGARQLEAYNKNYKLFRFNFTPKTATPFSINSAQEKELKDQADKICRRNDFNSLVAGLCDPAVRLVGPIQEKDHGAVRPQRPALQQLLAPRGL